MMQLFNDVGAEATAIAPPSFSEVLPEKEQLLIVDEEEVWVFAMAPPKLAEFFWKSQLLIVAEDWELLMAPPKLPEFSRKEQLLMVGEDVLLSIALPVFL